MATNITDKKQILELIKSAYNNCKPPESLPYGDERYVKFSESGLRGTDGDIVESLKNEILISTDASQQLFSGFRGSGKTTELRRLEHSLKEEGYEVIYIDIEEFLGLRQAVTISDMLIAIASGVDQYIADKVDGYKEFRGIKDRVWSFLNTDISIEKITVKVPGVDLPILFKENPEVRKKINRALEARRPELVKECRGFFDEALAILKSVARQSAGVVLIVDSFEKLQGTGKTAQDVRDSVTFMLANHWQDLVLPCHVIYTVPPWLAFTEISSDCSFGRIQVMPMVKVADQEGNENPVGIQAMLDLLGKRMDLKQLFGNEELLCPLASLSGGYPRDMLRMIQEVLTRNVNADRLPLDVEKVKGDVDRVISISVQNFSTALNGEDLPLLALIDDYRKVDGLPEKDKFRVAELFDFHFVLSYQNGRPWLALHPLLRKSDIVQKAIEEYQSAKEEGSGS
jgi:hypothetical protein